jgi:quercetin dioxygenase-like cupin family protein
MNRHRPKLFTAVAPWLLLAWSAAAVAAQQPSTAAQHLETTAANELAWEPITPAGFEAGMEIAVVRGDPGAQGQLYALRLRFPDGYRFPPHWHPVDENLTVLEGTFLLAMGEAADEAQLQRYAAGDYLFMPARHPHFGGAVGSTVIQLHGLGPFDIVVVGSPEDVR